MEPILELSGLSKVYPGGLTALDNVDLTINKGEVFGLELPPIPEPEVPEDGFPGLPLHPSSQ